MRKQYRLRASAEFDRVRREGRTWTHPLLILSTLPNGGTHSRFGFAVGRRIGKAAKPNRIKRRMREAVRLRLQKGEVAAGWDMVWIARRAMLNASYRQVDEAIGQLLQRAGLLGEKG